MTIAMMVKTRQIPFLMCELRVNEWLQCEKPLAFTRLFNRVRCAWADCASCTDRWPTT